MILKVMNKLLLSLALVLATTMPALHADWTTDYKACLRSG
jgi:hypothetical protein